MQMTDLELDNRNLNSLGPAVNLQGREFFLAAYGRSAFPILILHVHFALSDLKTRIALETFPKTKRYV